MNDKGPTVSGAASGEGGGAPAAPAPRAPEGADPLSDRATAPAPETRSTPVPIAGDSFPPAPRVRTNLTFEEVGPLWDSFRGGNVVACPCHAGALALSVDGNNAYRLVCTRCGTASSWFEAAPAGIRLRTIPPGPDDEAADI
jgi:hypothetical protein